MKSNIFQSFFSGGFECSTHRLCNGSRVDTLASTKHDRFAKEDYGRLQEVGIKTARDGIRWHLIEKTSGYYDWDSVLTMLHAARDTNTQIIWDILHFGWPDDIDIFKGEFVRRYAKFVKAFIQLQVNESDEVPFIAPINEPSFLSFASGERGFFYPCAHHRGDELKFQLVRAIIEGCEAAWEVCPQTRILHTDPIINIIAHPFKPQDRLIAETYRQSQFCSWDMISGRLHGHLGGHIKYLDILGLNYYINNQWIHNVGLLVPSHPYHLPLRHMMNEIYERYERPLVIAETGIEDKVRPDWLRYIGQEVRATLKMQIPLEGVCIYPIVDHPGWDDNRYCPNGLWGYANDRGDREIFEPLAKELNNQQNLFFIEYGSGNGNGHVENFEIDWNRMDSAAHNIHEMTLNSRD